MRTSIQITKKDTKSHENKNRYTLVFFLFGMLFNSTSQYFGYKINEQGYLMCEAELDDDPKAEEKYGKSSDYFTKIAIWFTVAGVDSMLLGLFSIMSYFLLLF